MTWGGWVWIVWGLFFAVFETLGLRRVPGAMTLTYFVEHHTPRWALAAFIGWFSYHFLIAPIAKR